MSCYLAIFVEGLFQITFRVKVIFIGMDGVTQHLYYGKKIFQVSSKRIEIFRSLWFLDH